MGNAKLQIIYKFKYLHIIDVCMETFFLIGKHKIKQSSIMHFHFCIINTEYLSKAVCVIYKQSNIY